MKKSVWGLIGSSFNEIQGLWIGFLGFVISVLLVRFPFKTPIPLDLVLIAGFFILLILFTLIKATNKAFNEYKNLRSDYQTLKENYQKLKRNQIPKILRIQQEKSSGLIICLFENSDLFATDLRVSFYYIDEYSFEALIGVGYVRTVQNDDKVQVVIDYPDPAYQDIVTRLGNSDSQVIEKTFIRLGIPRNFNQP
jgi:hypothetical protein